MTTITIEKAIVHRALSALEYHTQQTRPIHNTELVIEELRAALTAPATVPDDRVKELEAELAATEIAIAEYRQQCLDNAQEIARLRAESEERLQNCVALVAEVERLRAAPATAPAQPAWHDAPTCPGLWATVDGRHASAVVIPKHELSLYQKTTTRWFGPIPPDGDKP